MQNKQKFFPFLTLFISFTFLLILAGVKSHEQTKYSPPEFETCGLKSSVCELCFFVFG